MTLAVAAADERVIEVCTDPDDVERSRSTPRRSLANSTVTSCSPPTSARWCRRSTSERVRRFIEWDGGRGGRDPAGTSSEPPSVVVLGPVTTCLGDVDAGNAITVAPDGGAAVTFDGVAVGSVDAGDEDGVDLSFDASDPATVTVDAAGLDDGTDVAALGDDGSELAETTVEDGQMRFDDLPAGEYRVDLAEPEDDGNDGSDDGSDGTGDGDDDPDGGETDEDSPDVTGRTANVSQTTVETGATVTVNATLATDGSQAANDTIALRVDDVPVRNETVTVPAEGSRTVTLTRAFDEPGEYDVAVGDETVGAVTVEPAESDPTPRESDDGDDPADDSAADDPVQSAGSGSDSGTDSPVLVGAGILAVLGSGILAYRLR